MMRALFLLLLVIPVFVVFWLLTPLCNVIETFKKKKKKRLTAEQVSRRERKRKRKKRKTKRLTAEQVLRRERKRKRKEKEKREAIVGGSVAENEGNMCVDYKFPGDGWDYENTGWAALKDCESGGSAHSDGHQGFKNTTGCGGQCKGGFQFKDDTWTKAYIGSGMDRRCGPDAKTADQWTPRVQYEVAKYWKDTVGKDQWSCGYHLQ